jgi:Zn-dependent protease
MTNFNPTEAVISLIAMILSLTIHEYAHGLVSHIQGDRTPEKYGRLTLNPLAHIDIMGLVALYLFKFGWAKPIPISSYNYKNPRVGIILTSIAGPASNLLAAFFSAFVFYAFKPNSEATIYMLESLFVMNVGLAVFNTIPIPPLDGSKVIAEIFRGKVADIIYRIEGKGMAVLFVLLWLDPVRKALVDIRVGVMSSIDFLARLFI